MKPWNRETTSVSSTSTACVSVANWYQKSIAVLRPLGWRRFEDTLWRHWKILQMFAGAPPLCTCVTFVQWLYIRMGGASDSKDEEKAEVSQVQNHKHYVIWPEGAAISGCKWIKRLAVNTEKGSKIHCWSKLLEKPNCWVGRNVNLSKFI